MLHVLTVVIEKFSRAYQFVDDYWEFFLSAAHCAQQNQDNQVDEKYDSVCSACAVVFQGRLAVVGGEEREGDLAESIMISEVTCG